MKFYLTIIFLLLFAGISSQSYAQETKQEQKKSSSIDARVEVFYFHYSRRCATCNAVEAVSRDLVKEYENEQIVFDHFNMDEKAAEEKGKSLDVFGQTLLILGNDQRLDVTNEAFMMAKSNPDKLKKFLKKKIDSLL
jgi:hypothetical protein